MDTVSTLARALSRRFPSVPIWFGEHTGHWWALADNRLIEADSAGDLGLVLDRLVGPQPVVGEAVHRAEPSPGPARALASSTDRRPAARPRPTKHLSPWRHRFLGSWVPAPASALGW
ncbi:MAG: hypothetical protein JWO67_2733 [Streptosporangiaceae bacterium]|jgi:hypothetical protein|nr:hypothetical protein [Streptosporangiaceae bacterium]